MKKISIFLSTFIAAVLVLAAISISNAPAADAATVKTGVGLSEHVLMAYQQGWKYRSGGYGQFNNGVRGTDCSGLIKSYLWWTGESSNPNPGLVSVAGSSEGMLNSAKSKGTINYSDSSSLPRVHGLILYQPGHVGVYVGNNMAVDNRTTGVNMKYEKVFGRSSPKWKKWFKLPQITYPTTGFATFNGNQYYYENGQYVINTTKIVDGTSYTFGSSGTITSSTSAGEINAAKVEAAVAPAAAKKEATAKPAGTAKPAAPKTEPAYTALSVDTTSKDVKQLQKKLKDLGYYYEGVNEYYDYCVADAVSAYQNAAGLKVTGSADSKTLASLYSSSAPKNTKSGTLAPGIHSSLVTQMQDRLIELGYMSGDTSVYYGDVTKQAVLDYQKAAGVDQTGTMDAAALKQLYSETAVKNTTAGTSSAPISSFVEQQASSAADSSAAEEKKEIYGGMLPEAKAATVTDGTDGNEKQSSAGNYALFIVLTSGFLTGAFMLIKQLNKRGTVNLNRFTQKLSSVFSFLPIRKNR